MEDNFENKFKEYEGSVKEMLEKLMMRILLKLHRDADKIIRDNKAVASGEMVRNLRERVFIEAGKIIGVVGVGENVPYGLFRHEDCSWKKFPPIEPIAQWVIKKGLIKNYKGKSMSWKQAQSEGDDDDARQIAWAIAKKLFKKGHKGLPFLKMALEMNTDYIIQTLKPANA